MSRVAAGVAVPNTTIRSAPYNATIDDIITDLNTARPISSGGTGATNAAAARTALAVPGKADANTFTGANTFAGANAYSGTNSFNAGLGIAADKAVSFGATPEVEALYSTAGDKWILRALNAAKATMASFRFDSFELVDRLNANSYFRALPAAETTLFHAGQARLATEAAGAVITGRLRETDRAAERWQGKPAPSPAFATYYQNTLGRAIEVSVRLRSGASAGGTAYLSVAPTATRYDVTSGTVGGGTASLTLGARVPPDHYVALFMDAGGTLSIEAWLELR